jgi:hypothetical protein
MFSRYDVRPECEVTYTVYDVDTGQPAVFQGRILAAIGMQEADEIADLLNNLEVGLEKVLGEAEMAQVHHA